MMNLNGKKHWMSAKNLKREALIFRSSWQQLEAFSVFLKGHVYPGLNTGKKWSGAEG